MTEVKFTSSGFDELSKVLERLSVTTEKALDAIEAAAKVFTNDVRRLPKPRSQMSKAGYTHLLDTITSKRGKNEIEVGWGKYYGPMAERGTRRMRATPHIKPTFERNKEKYYQIIEDRLFK